MTIPDGLIASLNAGEDVKSPLTHQVCMDMCDSLLGSGERLTSKGFATAEARLLIWGGHTKLSDITEGGLIDQALQALHFLHAPMSARDNLPSRTFKDRGAAFVSNAGLPVKERRTTELEL